jgi:hypothetical protein
LPLGPVILISIGVLFLLDNLGILSIGHVVRYWPLLLIGAGVYSLYAKLSGPLPVVPPRAPAGTPPARPDVMGAPREQ